MIAPMSTAPEPPRVDEGFPGQRCIVLPRPVVRQALAKPLVGDLLPTDIGHYPAAAWHHVDRPGGAPQLILIHCVRGQGWSRIRGRRHTIGPGQTLLIPPHEPHGYGAAELHPWTIWWFHVAGRKIGEFQRLLDANALSPVFDTGEDASLGPLFEEILHTLAEGYTASNLLLASLTVGLLLGRLALSRRDHALHSRSTEERLEQAVAYMHRRLNGQVALPELASVANLSPSHFAALFKRKTGYSALDFFLRLKMQRACQLLDNTSLPIKSVAEQVGFTDPLYFSRRFRQIHGCPPLQYRAIRKG